MTSVKRVFTFKAENRRTFQSLQKLMNNEPRLEATMVGTTVGLDGLVHIVTRVDMPVLGSSSALHHYSFMCVPDVETNDDGTFTVSTRCPPLVSLPVNCIECLARAS